MGGNPAALHTAVNAVQALGRGFDVNFDTRLLYCKGVAGSRVVQVDEEHAKDLCLYDDLVVPNVSRDVSVSQVSYGRQQSGIYTYDEMAEHLNRKVNLSGSLPLGSFNAAFSFTGSKHIDAAATKTLSTDGFYMPLAKVEISKSPLVLQENVKHAVPSSWDPPSLASFIENFGTHVITSVTIGGKDVIYVKQHQSSPLTTTEIKTYVRDLALPLRPDQQPQGLSRGNGNIDTNDRVVVQAPDPRPLQAQELPSSHILRGPGGDGPAQRQIARRGADDVPVQAWVPRAVVRPAGVPSLLRVLKSQMDWKHQVRRAGELTTVPNAGNQNDLRV